MTENIPAQELALIGFSAVCYPCTLVAAKLKAIHEALENLKASMTIGAPPMILPADEVHKAVGFEEYWVRSFVLTVVYVNNMLDIGT